MMQQICRAIVDGLKVSLGLYCECRGIFRITDRNGNLLPGVQVSCRIGDGDWMSCGESTPVKESGKTRTGCEGHTVNFLQDSSLLYTIGEPVLWQFSKPGYVSRSVTRYTADKSFNETLNSVVLDPVSTYKQKMNNYKHP